MDRGGSVTITRVTHVTKSWITASDEEDKDANAGLANFTKGHCPVNITVWHIRCLHMNMTKRLYLFGAVGS